MALDTGKLFYWMNGKPTSIAKDGYPAYPNDPYGDTQQMLNIFLDEVFMHFKTIFKMKVDPKTFNTGSTFMTLKAQNQLNFIFAIFYRIGYLGLNGKDEGRFIYFYFTSRYFLRKHPLTPEQFEILVHLAFLGYGEHAFSANGFARAIEWFIETDGVGAITADAHESLVKLSEKLKKSSVADERKAAKRIIDALEKESTT